jgi:tetrapyrrole methylase family protein / MazG family protein
MSRSPQRPTVVAAGLGPAGPEHTTPAATDALRTAPVTFLRTARHPAAGPFLELANVVALDDCYETGTNFDEVYASIVQKLRTAAAQHGRVAYGVPGSPAVAERTVELLRADPSIELEIVPGLSFCELAWARLGVDPAEAGVRLVDAERFAVQAAGDAGPLLVGQCWSRAVLSSVKLAVEGDPAMPAVLLHHLGLADEQVVEVPWSEIDRTLEADHLTSLYVPQVQAPIGQELARFAEVVRVLRERCPWDREQTHQSLVRHLLEETYEAIEALEQLGDDPAGAPPAAVAHVEEELGDLLCQVMFHATLAEQEGLFTLGDVARTVHDKLVLRHPHVFGDVTATTPAAVIANWERIKQSEKRRTHLFEGVPAAMPALARAAKAERKLASVELGWPVTGPDAGALVAALAAVLRLADATSPIDTETAAASGALLVDLARLIAHRGEDPESLVRQALDRLGATVAAVEAAAGGGGDGGHGAAGGADLGALDPVLRLDLWRAAVAGS